MKLELKEYTEKEMATITKEREELSRRKLFLRERAPTLISCTRALLRMSA
jgi:hypothetical protein